jgi:hypothetical protein
MHATASRTRRPPAGLSHERRLALLGVLIAACMVSTTAHFTHNYLEIEHYPQSNLFSTSTVKFAIVTAWPALTASGVLGYWLFARRRYAAAYPLLAIYSLLGISTLGHFASGSPHIPAFWYATIFTDGLLGFAILAFAHWSAVMAPAFGRRNAPA